jgi:hypothetical protein
VPKSIRDEAAFLTKVRDRFGRAEEAERLIRKAATRDLRFLVGQHWEEGEAEARRAAHRPALTVNKLPPFVDQIANEQRKNRPGVKVSAVGGGADEATAEIFEGIIRHIEYSSQADTAYDTAFDYAVSSSFGAWRYTTCYVDDRSTDQDIRVTRIADPATVMWDPDAQEVDCSDAGWCFVFVPMSKEAFKDRYPDAESTTTDFQPIGGFNAPNWIRDNDIIVAEYWQVEKEKKTLTMYRGIPAPPEDEPALSEAPPALASQVNGAPGVPAQLNAAPPNGAPPAPLNPAAPAPAAAQLAPDADPQGYVTRGFYDDEEVPEGFEPVTDEDDDEPKSRVVEVRHVWRYDTNGHEILGKPQPWAGKYIPIVPTWGKEKIVDGVRNLLSAIRGALDPSQLYDFYKTAEAEVIQQTPKNPYIGALGQFKTMQMQWAEANVVPRAYLEYDPVAVGGQPVPPPSRQAYEPATQALSVGAAAANEDIKATTGLFDASRGAPNANADSGAAIGLLQQQGETSTYHFFDNFIRAMWHGYRILLDLIPRIYDTPRVVRIVRPDSEAEMVQIGRMFTHPKTGQRMQYDLDQGTYAVAVSVQQSYATRKMQSAAYLAELAKADPQQLPQWADLYVKQLELGPIGDEIADRLIPPAYRQGGDPQQIQAQAAQLSQQNAALTAQVQQLTQAMEANVLAEQTKRINSERDSQTKLSIAQMQEETRRMSDAIKLAIAEIEAKAQTGARALSDAFALQTEREANAHEAGMAAHDRAIALHDADQLPPGMPGGPPAPEQPDPNAPNGAPPPAAESAAQPAGVGQ